jgi:hypothetical protein
MFQPPHFKPKILKGSLKLRQQKAELSFIRRGKAWPDNVRGSSRLDEGTTSGMTLAIPDNTARLPSI